MNNVRMLIYFCAVALIFSISSCSTDSEEPYKKELETEIELRQMSIDFEPAPCLVVSDISIFIPDDCGPNWTNGILDAIQAYNDTDTGINFEQTMDEDDADISFSCLDFAEGFDPDSGQDLSNVIGIGEVPNVNGGIGAETFLNTDFEITCGVPCFFQGVVMHELGHNLGLFHNENTEAQRGAVGDIIDDGDGTFTFSGEGDDLVWIEGTIAEGTNDPTSIFNEATGCFVANCVFNANDIIALETLYPRPEDPCDCPLAFEPCDCLNSAPIDAEITGLCCLPIPKLQNDDCQHYHTYVDVSNGQVVGYDWSISPMTGVTIYNNSETSSIFIFSFDDAVVSGDDFVILVDIEVTDDICEEILDLNDSQIVEIVSCEGEEGGDQ